ncbi:MAG: prolyl oligopeptidase family serine peptidase [candidate division WOR-3 bacterium]|jgi:predicted esterase|nr:prolyl oligopeptidase family serine peptidase [candidate division WOR-3 bacterium]MCR4422972.1 prolyl oligopeptidase family serine peptidase [candidate division WOR-3 bacterium]MDH7518311.1 prolyl oligopeptidase family serine peptidase [bacterium]
MRKILPLVFLLFCPLFIPAAELPSIQDTILIQDWLLCGPFSVGVREGITEAIEDVNSLVPREGDALRSSLVQGGLVKWHKVRADSSGWLETDYQSVRWDSILNYYGIAGIMATGYAYAELVLPYRCRALVVPTKLGGFILNGKGYIGDVYGNNWFRVPVTLDSGTNRIVLRLSGFGDQRVRFLLVPVSEPIIAITHDVTIFDLIADSGFVAWCGLPLLNTTTEPIDQIRVLMKIDTFTLADTVINNIPAQGVKKPALKLKVPPLPFDSAGYAMVISLRGQNWTNTDTITLRSRKLTQPHRVTFLSEIDSSCQYYAVLYPKNYDPQKSYGLILSLHGAGVEASSLAECFQPKDWAFVVCPTNRRPYGFDWQDWGRIDALEVLHQAIKRFPIDPDRVVLTGHSMGGHGTWHIGLSHFDLFAAIAPAAGWPSLPLYVPTFLQKSNTFAEPAKLMVRDMAMRPDNVPAFLENAQNLPVFILHGADDDNVPALHGRNFALWLDALNYNYEYKEVPGQKHWWSYEDGTVCVDDTSLMRFLKESHRNSGPRHIRFRTADLAQSNSCYWAKIDRVETVGYDAYLEGFASDSVVKLFTENIKQLTLNFDQRLFFSGTIRLEIDRQTVIPNLFLPRTVTVHKTAHGWKLGRAKTAKIHKTPNRYGPAKQVLMKPFTIVYGTQNPALVDFLRHAANQEALRWFLIGNGTTEILPDTAPVPLNRNLILFGGPEENRFTHRIARQLPITVKAGKLHAALPGLQAETVAVILTYPNPLNPERLLLVRMGTDPQSTKLSFFFGVIGSGTAIPDFLIFDRRVRRYGWAGVRAAGFFDPDWNFDLKTTFLGR